MHKGLRPVLALVAAGLSGLWAQAAESPEPNEYSAEFEVRFDRLPSEGAPDAPFRVEADADGFVTVTLEALPTEAMGDYSMTTRTPVGKGEWHRVFFSYSRMRQRAALYLDGRWQYENDDVHIPEVRLRTAKDGSFAGELRGLVTTPYARPCHAPEVPDTVAWYKAQDKSGLTENFAVSVVPALSQVPVMPYTIHPDGKVTDELRVYACRDEYESASVVVTAFRPLTVKGVRVSDLTGPGGARIPAAETDVKLVKRWYRTGGAWTSYHRDSSARVLVPDLLVNDDELIRVDEVEKRNFIRLDYPEGRRWVDVSDPWKYYHQRWQEDIPFKDADRLQPARIPAAGRNLQYFLTFHAAKDAKPGFYRGTLDIDTDAGSKRMRVLLRVLPVDLPVEGSPMDALDRTYISHMNSLPEPEGRTLEERIAFTRKMLAAVRSHNLFHTSAMWSDPKLAELAFEAGMVPDRVFEENGRPPYWGGYFGGESITNLTEKDRAKGVRAAQRASLDWREACAKTFPEDARQYVLYHSESVAWVTVYNNQAEEANVLRPLGMRLFAHGWDNNQWWAQDTQNLQASCAISSDEAAKWHAAGGELMNYADPFPGSENPMWFRRRPGFMMYRTGLDGHMMHGFRQGRTPWNEWAVDWGGDGTYRNFCLCYPQQGGAIFKLAWEGLREAYDDVRYATRLQQLAKANLGAKSVRLQREAQRQLAWLERQHRDETDIDFLRAGLAERLLVMTEAIAREGGATPDKDMAIRKVLKK